MSEKQTRGRPRVYSNKSIIKIFLVMLFLRLTSLRSVQRTVGRNPSLKKACGVKRSPSYRTLGRRLPRLTTVVFPLVIQLLALLTQMGHLSWFMAAIDSSIMAAYGRPEQREWVEGKPKGKIKKKATDPDAKWGYSAGKDEWIFGFKLHIIVLVKPLILPICWLITSAAPNDTNFFIPLSSVCYQIARSLSQIISIFLGDSGYDSEKNRNHAVTLGNARLVAPIRKMKGKMSGSRKIIDQFNHSPQGKRMLRRRSDAERFYEQYKDLFPVDPLPVVGLANVTAYLSLANLAYLVAVVYNARSGRRLRDIKALVQ